VNNSISLIYAAISPLKNEWVRCSLLGPSWRLYLNDAEGASLTLKEGKFMMKPDHFYLLPSFTKAEGNCDHDVNQLYIHFRLDEDLDLVPRRLYSVPATDELRTLAQKNSLMLENISAVGLKESIKLIHLISAVLLECEGLERQTITENVIKKVITHINGHLAESLTVSELAGMACMSNSTFMRRFKQETGRSPHNYIMGIRCSQAMHLLQNTSLSIECIAMNLGFSSRFHFSKAFKNSHDLSPGEYRTQYR